MFTQKTPTRSQLYKFLTEYFSHEELRALTFELEIPFDNWPGSTKDKARELITYLERHGRLAELVEHITKLRPWAAAPSLSSPDIESSDSEEMAKFFQRVEEIEQRLNTILTTTKLDRDQALALLNQIEDTPDEFLLNSLALNASPELITYTARFALTEHLLGCYLVAQGRWYEGLRSLERSLVLRRRLTNLDDLADTVYQIGRTHHLMGNLEESRIRYRDALRLYRQTNNLAGIAACQVSLGNLDIQLGFVQEGKRFLTQARAFYMDSKDEERIKEVDKVLNLVQNFQEKQPA